MQLTAVEFSGSSVDFEGWVKDKGFWGEMKTCTVENGGSPEWVCVVDMRTMHTATARILALDPWGKWQNLTPLSHPVRLRGK